MSSHHFVRENQEPALFFKEVPASQPDWLGQLLEWNPIVIATLPSAFELIELGIKFDVLLAQDHQNIDQLNNFQPFKVISFQESDSALLLGQLFKHYPMIHIIGEMADSEQQWWINGDLSHELTFFSNDRKWVKMENRFEKWISEGDDFRILNPVKVAEFKVSGNYLELEKGVYKATKDGIISISSNQPVLVGLSI